MIDRTWARYAPLTGIAAVILWVIAFFILETGTEATSADSAEEVAAAYRDEENVIAIGGIIFMAGSLFFLWFLGVLRTHLHAAEGGLGRLAATAFGGGLVTGACLLLLPGGDIAGAIADNEDLTPEAAQALSQLDLVFFVGAEYAAILLVVAAGLAALRWLALPRWFGWFSFLLALVLLIAPIGWAGLIFGFPLWVLIASLFIWRGQAVVVEPASAPHA